MAIPHSGRSIAAPSKAHRKYLGVRPTKTATMYLSIGYLLLTANTRKGCVGHRRKSGEHYDPEGKLLEPALGHLIGPFFSGRPDLVDGQHASQHLVIEVLYSGRRNASQDGNQPRSEEGAEQQYHRPEGEPGDEEVGD